MEPGTYKEPVFEAGSWSETIWYHIEKSPVCSTYSSSDHARYKQRIQSLKTTHSKHAIWLILWREEDCCRIVEGSWMCCHEKGRVFQVFKFKIKRHFFCLLDMSTVNNQIKRFYPKKKTLSCSCSYNYCTFYLRSKRAITTMHLKMILLVSKRVFCS